MNDESQFAGALAHLVEQIGEATKKKTTDWSKMDVGIKREGSMITLPELPTPMPLKAAAEALLRRDKDEQRLMDVSETFEAHPLEALAAFHEAMVLTYGWASPVPTPGFFGPEAPTMVSIQTDVDTWIQVPFGAFKIPGIENNVATDVNRKNQLVIMGSVRHAEREVLLKLAEATRAILRDRSIYRGKALHITTRGAKLDLNNPPTFMDMRKVDKDELIFSKVVQEQVNVNLLCPIVKTNDVRESRTPLKRGVLLAGKFGVGKTLTSRVVALECITHGWTFINIDSVDSLSEALNFAKRYQPAVLFCEDVDRGTGERNERMNQILNTIDGIVSKGMEIMTVVTTNELEAINPAMLRPGRLDSVIVVTPPDAEAVERLIRLYARGKLQEGTDLTKVSQLLDGAIPAFIREVVERSKLAMIWNDHKKITGEDLAITAEGITAHRKLVEVDRNDKPSPGNALAAALGEIVSTDLLRRFEEAVEKGEVKVATMRG